MGFNAFQWGNGFRMTMISLNSDFHGTDYHRHAGHHCICEKGDISRETVTPDILSFLDLNKQS